MLIEKMENLYKFISDPSTLIEFLVFVFWLWATWSNLNGRIKTLERKTEEIDIANIETKLAEIQTDLKWLKMTIQTLTEKGK